MKNLFKKSVSIFLAVLMILSCWVWVAPEKAKVSAATITPAENYKVTVGFNLKDRTSKGGTFYAKVWYKTANGTGSSSSISGQDAGLGTGGDAHYRYIDINVPGFPYYIECWTVISGSFFSSDANEQWWDIVKINDGDDIFTNGYTFDKKYGTSDKKGLLISGSTKPSDAGASAVTSDHTTDWAWPYISGFVNSSEGGTAQEMTLNAIGGADVSKTTTFNYGTFYDQYKVKWTATVPSLTMESYISKTPNGDAYTSDDLSVTSDGMGINAKASLQVNDPQSSKGETTYYLVRKLTVSNEISLASAKYTIKYPTLTTVFDAKLSNAKICDKDGNVLNAVNGVLSNPGYYGSTFTAPSNEKTNADGYTFKGFWTVAQPTSGNASYNAKEVDFIEPMETPDGKTDGAIETIDGVQYYYAGKKWDPAENTIKNNDTYYGWWISKDLTIKFYDVDGKYLATTAVKHSQTQSAISWPTSNYSTYKTGAFTYTVDSKTWVGADGEEVSTSSYVFTHDLVLTPKMTVGDVKKTYTVNFVDPANDTGNLPASSSLFTYRQDISEIKPSDVAVPKAIENDLDYSYEFIGWSSVAPINGRYHIVLEDRDFDTAGTSIGINSDWIVRDDDTYYAVYRRYTRTYAVNFFYRDATGAMVSKKVSVKYGEALVPPTDDVPYTYAVSGYGYTFQNWKYTDGDNAAATLDYAQSIILNSDNIMLSLGAVDDGVGVTPIAIQPVYDSGKPTAYTVTFNYKNDKGEDVTKTTEVKHDEFILDEDVEALTPAANYDNGEALVTYLNKWEVKQGAADEKEYATGDLTSFSPTSHITFEAVYGNAQPFYTVTYIDGSQKFEERILVDSDLPVWTNKVMNDNETPDNEEDDYTTDVPYIPSMADDAKGSYIFQGWYDEAQADKTHMAVNGTLYGNQGAAGEGVMKVTGNVTLYPQFKFEPFTYTFTFKNFDGSETLAEGKYEYGQEISATVTAAEAAAKLREADVAYTYEFLGWDKEVPTVCEGKDMTFIAVYKAHTIYYKGHWYNGTLSGTWENPTWSADKSSAELATTRHAYNSKILSAPSAKTVYAGTDVPEGQNAVFAGWYYKDAQGNAVRFTKGLVVTEEMEFYATYTLSAKTYTVTTVVKDVETKYTVAEGGKAIIPDPHAGYVNATVHDEFAGWYTDATFANEFDLENTAITADTKIYAKFTQKDHVFDKSALKTAPTYYAEGTMDVWCECSTETTKTEKIAKLTDKVTPTGTIYLGTLGSWSSTDDAVTNDEEVQYYANAETDVIVTLNDMGDVSEYNPAGIGIGIKSVGAFVMPADQIGATGANETVAQAALEYFYYDETDDATNYANAVIELGNLYTVELDEDGSIKTDDAGNAVKTPLKNGGEYVVFYFAVDKADNNLRTHVRTKNFIYDTGAPSFDVDGLVTTAIGTKTYCIDDDTVETPRYVTIKNIEEGATLKVNGTVTQYTDGAYTIDEIGNYLITVTDKAGNSTSKKIKVGTHDYVTTEVAVTCEKDGYKKTECTLCSDVTLNEVTKTQGHDFVYTVTPATCTENGYSLGVCNTCGIEVKTEKDADGNFIAPAFGHHYEAIEGEDAVTATETDKIKYTTVTAATCLTTGKAIANCVTCGAGTLTKDLAIDSTAHKWGATKTLKATCTDDGKTYHVCKLCTVSNDIAVIPATGHVETEWVVTTEATCGAKGVETLTCVKCGAGVDSDDEDTVVDTREIPATGRHIVTTKELIDEETQKATHIIYYCKQCGTELKREAIAEVQKVTVKFINADGTELKKMENVVVGTDIAKTDAPTATKAQDNEYTYTFSGWLKVTGDGETATETAVTLPLTVDGEITLKAAYKATVRIYTHKFFVPTTWISPLSETEGEDDAYATIIGAYGDTNKKPVAIPVFKHEDADTDAELKKLYTFTFSHWEDANGNEVTDFTMTEDKSFYAVFDAVATEYQVTYLNGTDYVWHTSVEGGKPVVFAGTEPTKAYDNNYHYAFDKWYTDATLKTEYKGEAIKADTKLYAGFTAIAHTYDKGEGKGTVTQSQTCILPELTEYACTCDHKITEQTKDAKGHTPAAAVSEVKDGITYSVVYCSVCNTEISRTKTSIEIIFKNYNGVRLATKHYDVGADIVYDGATPTKAADAKYTYTFEGWFVENDLNQTVVTFGKATADTVYVAKFTPVTRTFRVTYVDKNNKVLQTTDGIAYDGAVPAFTGTAPANEEFTTYVHYVFDKWSVTAGSKVTSDIVITPVYKEVKHEMMAGVASDATCTQPGGTRYACKDCDYAYTVDATTPAKGHSWDAGKVTVAPNHNTGVDGVMLYTCTVCKETKEEAIKAQSTKITVKVVDKNGAAVQGANVKILDSNKIVVYEATTDASGTVVFVGPKGTYTYTVSYDGKVVINDQPASDGSTTTTPGIQTEPECNCSCHNTGFWGIIFRLFHKIIKLFTGKIGCCSCPSEMYN